MEIEDCVERRYWCGIRSSSDSSECKDPDFFPVENGGITYNYRKNYRKTANTPRIFPDFQSTVYCCEIVLNS